MIGFTTVVLTKDKNYLIAGDFDGFIHVFPIKQLLILPTGELILADRESVKILSASFLTNTIAASQNQSKPRSLLNSVINPEDIKKYKINEEQSIKSFLCKNENIYVGTESGLIGIFDKATEKLKNEVNTSPYLSEALKNSTSRNINPLIALKQNPITCMVATKGGYIVVGSQIGVIQIWKVVDDENLEYVRTLKHDNNSLFDTVYTLSVFYGILLCGHNGFVTAWDIETGNVKYVINTQNDVYFIKVTDENKMFVGGDSKFLVYYQIGNGEKIKSIITTNNANLNIFYESTLSGEVIDSSSLFVVAGSSQFLDVFYNNQRVFLLSNSNYAQIQQLKLYQQSLAE